MSATLDRGDDPVTVTVTQIDRLKGIYRLVFPGYEARVQDLGDRWLLGSEGIFPRINDLIESLMAERGIEEFDTLFVHEGVEL